MDTPKLSLYSLSPTDRDDVFRVVDLNGDWRWYFDKKKDRYVPAVNAVLDSGYPKDKRFHDYLLSVSKDEAKKILETAGERGSRVHGAIQLLEEGQTLSFQQLLPNSLTGRPEPLTMSEWLCLLSWAQFVQDFNMTVVPCKRTVVGDGYAGTLDDIVEITVPESAKRSFPKLVGTKIRVLLDYKTSGAIYDSYWAQVASYFMGDHGVEGITHTGILRLGTAHKNGPLDGAGYEFKVSADGQIMQDYAEFRCARRFWQRKNDPFDSGELSASIPSSLTVSVPIITAPIAEAPKAEGTESNATEAEANARGNVSNTEADPAGLQGNPGGAVSGGVGGRSASGDGVQGGEEYQAPVPVRHIGRGGVRRRKTVSKSKSDGKQLE